MRQKQEEGTKQCWSPEANNDLIASRGRALSVKLQLGTRIEPNEDIHNCTADAFQPGASGVTRIGGLVSLVLHHQARMVGGN